MAAGEGAVRRQAGCYGVGGCFLFLFLFFPALFRASAATNLVGEAVREAGGWCRTGGEWGRGGGEESGRRGEQGLRVRREKAINQMRTGAEVRKGGEGDKRRQAVTSGPVTAEAMWQVGAAQQCLD